MAHRVFILSDSTGETAERVFIVGAEQFPNADIELTRVRDVRTPAQVAQVFHAAAQVNGIVLFTLADQYLRRTALVAATEHNVPAVDVFGPVVSGLGELLGREPLQQPGHPYDPAYFERLRAFDFVTQHDDGKRPEGLTTADVVILGLSRTGKSPLCRMLAEHRIKAANVPIVPGPLLTPFIDSVDPARVFVLRMAIDRLIEVRRVRMNGHGVAEESDYTNRASVREEMQFVTRLLDAHPGWTPLDITRVSIEEVVNAIRGQYPGPLAEQ